MMDNCEKREMVSQKRATADTKKAIAVKPCTTNLLRIQVLSDKDIGRLIDVDCTLLSSGQVFSLKIVVSSIEKSDFAVQGRWFEQYLLFTAGVLDEEIVISCRKSNLRFECEVLPTGIELLGDHNLTLCDRVVAAIKEISSKTIKAGKENIPLCYNANTVLPLVEKLREANTSPLALKEGERLTEEDFPRIACWGKSGCMDMLAACLGYAQISDDHLLLVESGYYELILVDKSEYFSSPAGSRLARAISRSQSLSLFVYEADEYIALENGDGKVELLPLADLLSVVPSMRDGVSFYNVFFPCASDCYQYDHAVNMIETLTKHNYRVGLSEWRFEHVPDRTVKLFSSGPITIFPRLSLESHLAQFRQYAFVVIYCSKIKGKQEQMSLALLALYSGAIPIFFGGPAPFSYEKIIPHFYCPNTLVRFLKQHENRLLFHRTWLIALRQVAGMHSLQRSAFLDGRMGKAIADEPVELICVSKRPGNISIIADNFRRQKYKNIQFHIVWNVDKSQEEYCKTISENLNIKNLNVSVFDEKYNIGTCLNHGILASKARYWFKIDDDDYYGENYIVDMMMMYTMTGADALCKPQGLISFDDSGAMFIRRTCFEKILGWLKPGQYGCGATLSAKADPAIPLFSTVHRNSCDSNWIEQVMQAGKTIFAADCFNYCNIRYDLSQHTWKLSHKRLAGGSQRLGRFSGDWIHAN